MEKILFYSLSLTCYLKKHKWSKEITSDYFDIEAQKSLPFLGYSYKNSPVLLSYDSAEWSDISNYGITLCYNVDAVNSLQRTSNLKDIVSEPITGVVYNCQ